MMIDRGSQVLKLAARRGVGRTLGDIAPTHVAIDLGQRFVTEEGQERPGPLRSFLGPSSRRCHIPQIAGNHVGYRDLIGITGAARHRFEPLAGDVFGEQLLSPATIVNAASSALPVSAVILDVPDGSVRNGPRCVPPGTSEQQAGSLGGFRHSSLIRSIAASVV
jgi:hypothetical protein